MGGLIALIALFLLSGGVFGGISASIGSSRNRNPFSWFWAGFLFSFVGVIWAMAMPPLEPVTARASRTPQPRANLGPQSEERTCPYCAETIKATAILCRYCGSDLGPGAVVDKAPSSIDLSEEERRGLERQAAQTTGVSAIVFGRLRSYTVRPDGAGFRGKPDSSSPHIARLDGGMSVTGTAAHLDYVRVHAEDGIKVWVDKSDLIENEA